MTIIGTVQNVMMMRPKNIVITGTETMKMSKPNTPNTIKAFVYMELDGEIQKAPMNKRRSSIHLWPENANKGTMVRCGRPVVKVDDKWLYRVSRCKMNPNILPPTQGEIEGLDY